MKASSNTARLLALSLAMAASLALRAQVPAAAAHPGYLHALGELRAARWLLQHRASDPKVYAGEDEGLREIDAAIGEIRQASIDDGKDRDEHPPIEVPSHGSRLLRAVEMLQKARADIAGEEEMAQTRELRRGSLGHIERAIDAAESAHAQWLREVKR